MALPTKRFPRRRAILQLLRLFAVALATTTGLKATGPEQILFTYDADGQRVATESRFTASDTKSGGSTRTRFLIDPLAPGGFPQILARLDDHQHLVVALHGLGPIHESAAEVEAGTASRYWLSDGSGSVRGGFGIPSASPASFEQVSSYDAFGNPLEPATSSSYGFRGEWFEEQIGALDLRARNYSVSCGCFASMDSFEGVTERPSSQHKYGYAESDPVNRRDPSGHESIAGISVATSIGSSLHSLYNEGVSNTGFALTDTVQGVQAGLTADTIYQEYLFGSSLGYGVGVAFNRGAKVLSSLQFGRGAVRGASVSRRLFALLGKESYWRHAGGITAPAARAIAASHGFALEIGRFSRFENARNAVIIGRQDLVGDEINRIMLAEEIQHGLDRATSEASQAIKRGLDNIEFHVEVFHRIIDNYQRGYFPFLTGEDIQGLQAILNELK